MNIKNSGTARATRMLSMLRRRWYVVALATVLAGTATFAVSSRIAPVYESGAALFFSLRDGDSGSDINQGLTYTQNQMLSYAELASTAAVLDRAAQSLGNGISVAKIRQSVDVTTPQNTVILEIKARTTNRELSARISNSVAESLKNVVAEVAPVDTSEKPTVVARLIQPAEPAKFQSSPNKTKNAVLGAFGGGAFALLVLFLIVVFDTRIRSLGVLKSSTDLPVLGIAERTPASADDRPIALRSPHSSATERYRQLRAALRFTSVTHELRTIVVSSSVPSEGKTSTALNLALTMAEGTERILLIDADLRRPRIAQYLGLEPTLGLTTVVVGGVPLSDAVQRFGNTRLDVLTSGDIPPNPSELLDSLPMQDLLVSAKATYDVIILDTPPVLSVSDASIIAPHVDSAVIVIDSSKLRFAQLEQATDILLAAGAHISGLILNRVKPVAKKDDYFGDRSTGAGSLPRSEQRRQEYRPRRRTTAHDQRSAQ